MSNVSKSMPNTSSATQPQLPPGPRLPLPAQSILVWNRTVPFFASCKRLYGPVFTIRSLP
jgi:hypothetical protein